MPSPRPNSWVEALPSPQPPAGPHSAGGGDLLLHLGEAWFEPAPAVSAALARLGPQVSRYPDAASTGFREALSAYTGFPPEWILPGNGSDALIDQLISAWAGPDRPVAAPAPTFFVYGHSAALRQAPLFSGGRAGQAEAFAFSPERFLRELPAAPGIIFLASPNNPTGDLIPAAVIRFLLEQTTALVVVDECYYEFAGQTVAPLLREYEHLIILRSLSKSFALAGLRAGYALAHPALIRTLAKVDQTFSVNLAAQVAAVAALSSLPYYRPLFAQTAALRQEWATLLEGAGLRVFPSAANILLADYSALGPEPLAPRLLQAGIHVADFHARGPIHHCLRLTVADRSALERTRAALEQSLRAD